MSAIALLQKSLPLNSRTNNVDWLGCIVDQVQKFVHADFWVGVLDFINGITLMGH